jgi:hypothetical protein
MDFNEHLAMKLAEARIAEARAAAERARLFASAGIEGGRRHVGTIGSFLMVAGRWLVGAPATSPSPDTGKPSG